MSCGPYQENPEIECQEFNPNAKYFEAVKLTACGPTTWVPTYMDDESFNKTYKGRCAKIEETDEFIIMDCIISETKDITYVDKIKMLKK